MTIEQENKPLLDLSSVVKFFTDAVTLAYESAQLSEKRQNTIQEIEDVEGEAVGWSLYESVPGVSFKKFYAARGTKISNKVCKDYFKLLIVADGDLEIKTEYTTVRLPKSRKFFYLNSEDIFNIEFYTDSWFYILSMPL